MRLTKWAACVGFIFLSHQAVASTDSSTTYKNQRGSNMVLTWHHSSDVKKTGTLTGTFTTAVGKCKEDIGVPVPLTGYFNGNAISIAINFPHCKAAVGMTGNVSQKQDKIQTLWLTAYQVEDPFGKDWNSNIIGTDTFKKVS